MIRLGMPGPRGARVGIPSQSGAHGSGVDVGKSNDDSRNDWDIVDPRRTLYMLAPNN